MTKGEELALLGQIDNLIDSAGADSYIGMTFAGIVGVCTSNILNDFGDCPVKDLALERERRNADVCMKNAEIDALKKERDGLRNTLEKEAESVHALENIHAEDTAEIAKLKDERDAMTDCVDGLQEIIDKQESEIIRLKAELYDYMRKERDAK